MRLGMGAVDLKRNPDQNSDWERNIEDPPGAYCRAAHTGAAELQLLGLCEDLFQAQRHVREPLTEVCPGGGGEIQDQGR